MLTSLRSAVSTTPPIDGACLYLFIPLLFVVVFLRWLFTWPGSKAKVKPIRASTFNPQLVPKKIDTIVIGSGSGGCTASNLLAQSGQRVLVLEQHCRTGGCTHSFRQEGCEFDTGLHYTSAAMGTSTKRPGALMDFMSHGLQRWTHLDDPYDQIIFPGINGTGNGNSIFSFMTGADKTVDSIINDIDPGNTLLKERAKRYMALCMRINGGFTALGLSRVLPSWLKLLVRKRVNELNKFASYTVRNVQYAMFNLGYTADDLLSKGCPTAPSGPEPNPNLRRLKAVLTHPIGDYAVQPREATMAAHGVTMAHYMDGACYSVGATQNISIRNTSMVREMGGEVLVDAMVREILVESGRAVGVRVSSTTDVALAKKKDWPLDKIPVMEIRAKNIVYASSIYNLYNTLLPKDLKVVQDFADPHERTVRQSNGHIFLFCKIRGDASELQLPTHNLWYFNNFDMDEGFDDYFEDPKSVRPPTVYIGFPCTKDSSWQRRFPGVSNCILISDGLWEWFEKWQDKPLHERGQDYEEFKATLAKHLLDILYESVPQVKGNVEYHELGTPLSEVTFLNSWHGGSYGTKCTPEMFAKINRQWTTTPHTKIPGLYLAGSDAFLPAVCGAMYGGAFGACAVLGHLGTLRMMIAFLSHFAECIRKDNPKLSWPQAYWQALYRFVNE